MLAAMVTKMKTIRRGKRLAGVNEGTRDLEKPIQCPHRQFAHMMYSRRELTPRKEQLMYVKYGLAKRHHYSRLPPVGVRGILDLLKVKFLSLNKYVIVQC
nr:unnamed protein product [Haemonchus contortus]